MSSDDLSPTPKAEEAVRATGPKRFGKPDKSRSGISLKLSKAMRNTASIRELEHEIQRQVQEQDPDIPQEVLKEIVHSIATDIKRDERKNSAGFRLLKLLLPAIVFFMLSVLVVGIMTGPDLDPKFEKTAIQQDLSAAIRNGVDVETLKIVFRTRSIPAEGLSAYIHSRNYYPKATTTLLDVLNDLKVGLMVRKDALTDQERAFIGRIDEILSEYSKVNPFDGLEENQRRDLANLAKKLSATHYAAISEDVNSLVIELKQKNSLVNKYLNSSEISLWLSIVALALTVGLAFWQFRPKARKTQKELIQEALSEFNLNRSVEPPRDEK